MIRNAALALLLLSPLAAADGVKAWKDEVRRIDRLAQKYWGDFQKHFTDALVMFDQPRMDAAARPNDAVNYVNDYTGLRNLYAEYARFEEGKGRLDLALAASGDPKALPELFDALLDVAKRIDDLESDLLKARPQQSGVVFDQRPSIERHGIELRLDALRRALAQCPGAAAFLAGEGMKTAEKKDGRRSIVRRVAVIDTLGLCAGEVVAALKPYAAAPESSFRIAAIEALLRHGPAARPVLEPLLADRSMPVRRALLQGIAASASDDPAWIAPVLAAYRTAFGVVRQDCVRALAALTNQKYGDAEPLWEEWFADYKGEIEGGKFRKDAIEIREVATKPSPSTCAFYGVPTPAPRVVFALEASRRIYWPADLDALLKAYKETWHRTRRAWEDRDPSHHAILLREFDKASAAFAPDLLFGALSLEAACDAKPLGSSKLLRAEKRDIRSVRRDLERLTGDGWCAQYEGLLAAASLLGMGPESDADFPDARADVIYLWSAGGPEGGRYMTPESAVAAFRRFNRFRRLVVHAIRICDEGEPSETLMKGLAEATGGTYLFARKPPGQAE